MIILAERTAMLLKYAVIVKAEQDIVERVS